MSETVIKVENLTKFYQLGLINHGTLAKDLQGWWAKLRGKEDPNSHISLTNSQNNDQSTDFIYALKDVSFDVKQGEVLGIIGANGAGKSTLLKILSRVTSPTSGCIKIKGRIGSLLEVGTGFHPELTGRENIYLNGAILGMRRHEIDKKLDEIIDFSGVEKFIDTPVKRYSSGMYVRLAFAVAAHLDPEILVVDEVLAVGDAEFQKKALGKMQDVSKGAGRTVLFVSHNMAAVRQLCTRGILLDNGKIKNIGNVDSIVSEYIKRNCSDSLEKKVYVSNKHRIYQAQYERGILFDSFEFCKEEPVYASNEDIDILITIKSVTSINDCRINCSIFDNDDTPIGTSSSFDKFNIKAGENKILYSIRPTRLVAGDYNLSFSIGIGNTSIGETNFDVAAHIIIFKIDCLTKEDRRFFSMWKSGWGKIYFETQTKYIEN